MKSFNLGNENFMLIIPYPVPDPDLEIRGRAGLQKRKFLTLGASVWSNNRGWGGWGGGPGPLLWIRH